MRTIEFTRVKKDINGNPRYVCHFFALLRYSGNNVYNHNLAVKRAHTIGGKRYRGKDFKGGIVFQCYSLDDLTKSINELLK